MCFFVLIVLLPAFALGGHLADEKSTYTMAGFDPSDVYRDWNTNLFFQRMQQKTGIQFHYSQYSDAKTWQQAKKGMTAESDLPDVLFKAEITPAEAMDMRQRGVLIDLMPLLEMHAPNLWALLQQHPEYHQALTLPDGSIAALPYIDLFPAQNCIWINQDWLDQLKLPMPTTADEFEQMLLAFKEKDPNRNGKKDEVPLTFTGAYDLKYLGHAFGLVANDYNLFVQDNQVRFMPSEPAFQDFISWCAGLYQSKLIDADSFVVSDVLRRVTDAKSTPIHGVIMAPMVSYFLPVDWTQKYVALEPMVYENNQVYRSITGPVTTGTFAITSACEQPEEMLNWVDYLYSQEGAILASEGVEGEDYLVDGDGTWRKTEEATQNSFLSNVAVNTGAVAPGISSDEFQQLYYDPLIQNVSKQVQMVASYAREPFPPFSLSNAQEQEVLPLQNALGRYVDESIGRWVLGEWETSQAQFDLFYQGLEERGLPGFLAFWQNIYQVEDRK